ncbi:MAG: hypothetical protein ACK41T_07390 [Pseudobdellovibrio sp.]
MKLYVILSTLIFGVLSYAQLPYPLITVEHLKISRDNRIQLEKSVAVESPSMIVVTDAKSAKTSIFVNGLPERNTLSGYVLVDVIEARYDLDAGHSIENFDKMSVYKIDSHRMKHDIPLTDFENNTSYSIFWKNLLAKESENIYFYADKTSLTQRESVQCTSHACISLNFYKGKKLYHEIKQNFSTRSDGSDVLVLLLNGANSVIPKSVQMDNFIVQTDSYWERWSELSRIFPKILQSSAISLEKVKLDKLATDFDKEDILIDSRKPVAGNGDTASSIYLIQNLIRRGFKGRIDILADDKSEKILKALSRNLPAFHNHVQIIKEQQLTSKVYSLIIRSGLPSGRILVDSLNNVDETHAQMQKINFNKDTIFMSSTIYGNTQNTASVQPLSLIGKSKDFYLFEAPGFSISRSENSLIKMTSDHMNLNFNEAGIFRDPFSLSIRNWSIETAEKFLKKQSKLINEDLYQLFNKVSLLRKENKLKYTLSYGFSIPQVKNQAKDYFKSLLNSPTRTVVITPSLFSEQLYESFSEIEKKKIKVLTLKEFASSQYQIPSQHLVIIQIPNVPHPLFSTLLLASHRNRVVPLGAGDGFFTTALSLGVPFAPTVVDWNIRNIRALARLLHLEGVNQGMSISYLNVLRKIYSAIPADPVDLSHAQQLLKYENLFRKVITSVPDLTLSLDYAVNFVRTSREQSLNKSTQQLKNINLRPVNENTVIYTKQDTLLCKNLF